MPIANRQSPITPHPPLPAARAFFPSICSFQSSVAGRGGRVGVQGDILAVPRRGRESELRVCPARSGGARTAAGWTGTVLRCARAHAASLKGTFRSFFFFFFFFWRVRVYVGFFLGGRGDSGETRIMHGIACHGGHHDCSIVDA